MDNQIAQDTPTAPDTWEGGVICLQLSAVFELCRWPVPQMFPYALDQSPSLLSLCEGAAQLTITSIAAEK